MTRQVVVLSQAAADLEVGMDFYDGIEPGVGAYFRDSLISDILDRLSARAPAPLSLSFVE
jgi:hypothetical protein